MGLTKRLSRSKEYFSIVLELALNKTFMYLCILCVKGTGRVFHAVKNEGVLSEVVLLVSHRLIFTISSNILLIVTYLNILNAAQVLF